MNEITLVVEVTDATKPDIISYQCNNTHVQNNTSALMEVIVTVQDLNDNPPVFRDTKLSKLILQDTMINTIVMDLSVRYLCFIILNFTISEDKALMNYFIKCAYMKCI